MKNLFINLAFLTICNIFLSAQNITTVDSKMLLNNLTSNISSVNESSDLIDSLTFTIQFVDKKYDETPYDIGQSWLSNQDFDIKEKAYIEDGLLINSDFLNGLSVDKAKETVKNKNGPETVEKKRLGNALSVFSCTKYICIECMYRCTHSLMPEIL